MSIPLLNLSTEFYSSVNWLFCFRRSIWFFKKLSQSVLKFGCGRHPIIPVSEVFWIWSSWLLMVPCLLGAFLWWGSWEPGLEGVPSAGAPPAFVSSLRVLAHQRRQQPRAFCTQPEVFGALGWCELGLWIPVRPALWSQLLRDCLPPTPAAGTHTHLYSTHMYTHTHSHTHALTHRASVPSQLAPQTAGEQVCPHHGEDVSVRPPVG